MAPEPHTSSPSASCVSVTRCAWHASWSRVVVYGRRYATSRCHGRRLSTALYGWMGFQHPWIWSSSYTLSRSRLVIEFGRDVLCAIHVPSKFSFQPHASHSLEWGAMYVYAFCRSYGQTGLGRLRQRWLLSAGTLLQERKWTLFFAMSADS